MNLTPARYLIRFDDFCPTMSWSRWAPFEKLLQRYGVSPIVAVVPDNRDDELKVDAPLKDFWSQMQRIERGGATIGLHGYRHLCLSQGRSLIPFHAQSEFAGVELSRQIEWLQRGLEILRSHKLNPRLFVAPRHGFDRSTLHALGEVNLPVLSDGITRVPYRRDGVLFLPQQLWEPAPRTSGLWTICMHSNTASRAHLAQLERFLEKNANSFTTFEEATREGEQSEATVPENLYASAFLARFRARRVIQQLQRTPVQTLHSLYAGNK